MGEVTQGKSRKVACTKGQAPEGGAPELALNEDAPGLGREACLTPVCGVGSARGRRAVTGETGQTREENPPGLQTDCVLMGPKPPQRLRVKFVLCIQSYTPVSSRSGKLGAQPTWMIWAVVLGSDAWQVVGLMPWEVGGRAEGGGQAHCRQGVLEVTQWTFLSSVSSQNRMLQLPD